MEADRGDRNGGQRDARQHSRAAAAPVLSVCSANECAKLLLNHMVVQPPLMSFTLIDSSADSAVCSPAGGMPLGAQGFW